MRSNIEVQELDFYESEMCVCGLFKAIMADLD